MLFKTLFSFHSRTLVTCIKQLSDAEILRVLSNKWPTSKIRINDISGGCGSMFEIYVEAIEFNGLTTIQQQRLVNKALGEHIPKMHGIRVYTKAASDV
ncbi:hypothetical protein GJ496_005252 [Pomphorhynchus laevis]|nr:hypothetical protein GJ496_005252 [Pomphorhynchus laevis]